MTIGQDGPVTGPLPHPPPSGGGTSSAPVSTGSTPTHSVTGPVDQPPHLAGLEPPKTPNTGVDEREIDTREGQNTPGLKKKDDKKETAEEMKARELKELETMSPEELETKKKEKLSEAAKKSALYEEHHVMGMAEKYLDDPLNAPKDLKVTITPAGSTEVITLIPWSEELEKRHDIEDLMKTAKKVLAEHRSQHFADFNPDEVFNQLESLKSFIKEIADKQKDNKHQEGVEDHDNNWETEWKAIRHKQAYLQAPRDPVAAHPVVKASSHSTEKVEDDQKKTEVPTGINEDD